MKLLLVLSLLAFASCANVKRQVLLTQSILPLQQHVPQQPVVAVVREQIHHVPFLVQEQQENKEQIVEQQQDNSAFDASSTLGSSIRSSTEAPIVQENNQQIVQENQSLDATSTDLEHNTTHDVHTPVLTGNNESHDVSSHMTSGHSQSGISNGFSNGFSSLRDSLLDSLQNHGNQENLPVMIPLNPNFQVPNFQAPNFQAQNPILGQMMPNHFYNTPIVHSLTPNYLPYSSYVLPTPHYTPIVSTAQYLTPVHLPKPAFRQFHFPTTTTTTTTIAPEVSVKDTLITKGSSIRSGVKGGHIGTRSGTKSHFTPTDAPVMQHSI